MNERRKRNSRPNSTATHLWWQSRSIEFSNTWRATEGILFFVRKAPMAKLLLLSLLDSQSWITNQHPEAFGESCDGALPIVWQNYNDIIMKTFNQSKELTLETNTHLIM